MYRPIPLPVERCMSCIQREGLLGPIIDHNVKSTKIFVHSNVQNNQYADKFIAQRRL